MPAIMKGLRPAEIVDLYWKEVLDIPPDAELLPIEYIWAEEVAVKAAA